MNSKRIDDSNCGHEEFCQSLRPGDRDCNCEKAQEDSEVSRLRELASVCYAGLVAECNLPDTWADVFLAASQGEPFTTEELLPFTYQSPQTRGDMVLVPVEAMAALPAKWRKQADDTPEMPEWSASKREDADELEAAYRGEAATQDDLTPGGTVEADTDRELPGMWERADFIDNREQPATPAKGGAIDVNWLFNLIRDAEWGLKKLRIRGDDYSLGHEARSVALRLEAGDFAKARKMLNGTLQPATPAWDGECYERAYVTGYRAALRAAAAECRRIGEAIDHRGMAYVRYEDAIKCAVAVGALSPPSIVSATPAGGGDLPERLDAMAEVHERDAKEADTTFWRRAMNSEAALMREAANELRRLASTGSAPAPSGWRPIESAPKDGTHILIGRPFAAFDEDKAHVVRWDDNWWQVHDGKFDNPLRGNEPTHWQPIPAAPTPERRG